MEHFEPVICIILAAYFFLDIHFKLRRDKREFNPNVTFDKFADKVISKLHSINQYDDNIDMDIPEKGNNLNSFICYDFINVEKEKVYSCSCNYLKINKSPDSVTNFDWVGYIDKECPVHAFALEITMNRFHADQNIHEIVKDLKKIGRIYHEEEQNGTGSETTG